MSATVKRKGKPGETVVIVAPMPGFEGNYKEGDRFVIESEAAMGNGYVWASSEELNYREILNFHEYEVEIPPVKALIKDNWFEGFQPNPLNGQNFADDLAVLMDKHGIKQIRANLSEAAAAESQHGQPVIMLTQNGDTKEILVHGFYFEGGRS